MLRSGSKRELPWVRRASLRWPSRVGTEEDRQSGRADQHRGASRVDARIVRGRRRARARARAQGRRHDDVRSRALRPLPRRHPQALSRHDRAVLDRRPQRHGQGTRRDVVPPPGHGLARDRFRELQDDDLRESSDAGPRSRAADARLRREARDRDLRPRHALQRCQSRRRWATQAARPRAVRARRAERVAGRPRGARVRGRAARAHAAGGDLDCRGRRPLPADRERMDARARRPLPHRPRGQHPLRQGAPRREQRAARRARRGAHAQTTGVRSRRRPRRGGCSGYGRPDSDSEERRTRTRRRLWSSCSS